MRNLMMVVLGLSLIQPLVYALKTLRIISRQQKKLYPLLRVKSPLGIRPLVMTGEAILDKSFNQTV